MRLAVKLVRIVVLGIVIVLVVDGYVSLKRERDLSETDMHHAIRVLGSTIRQLVVERWHTVGRARAWKVIADANQADPSIVIRWVWLDAPGGDPCAPRVPYNGLEPVIQGQDVSFTERDENGQACFYSYFAIAGEEQRPGAIEVREPLSKLDQLARGAFVRIVGLTGLLVLLSGCAALLLGVRLIGRPLDQVVQKMRRVGTGDFAGPLLLYGHGELDELAAGLNTMCEQLDEARAKVRSETEARIAALEQLRHEDRLKTLGRLASGMAHELGTPLNVISGYAGMIAGGSLSSQETAESAQTIKAQSERIANTIRRILDFARQRPGQRTPVDLRQLVRQTLDLMAPLAQKQNVKLALADGGDTAVVRADVEQIRQVVLNLTTNAVQAMPWGGNVEVAIGPAAFHPPAGQTDPGRRHVCISVRDEGEGISAENLNHIFEPFFTTKGPGQGTGLGLAIAEGIIREHGGWISVESTLGKGSWFCVYLPREEETCRHES
ncbi:MAG: ATP-binding protein [Planctomycetes bacterium]|nr:ATP-binding protein [Planctomycetota bacterium]